MTHPYDYPTPSPAQARGLFKNQAAVTWILLPIQIFLTGLLTYVAIALWTVYGGAYSEGLQVIGFALFSTPLTVVAFLVGLPLRLARPLRRWWFERSYWVWVLFGIALFGIVVSYYVGSAGPIHYSATSEWPASDGYVPEPAVFLPSLVLLAVATMHLLPPLRARGS